MAHLVLLGDSILDNAAYVPPGKAVSDHLRAALPGWTITLLAVDGSTTAHVGPQIAAIPADATHLVLSIGGNDALQVLPRLVEPARTIGEALLRLADITNAFRADYARVLAAVLERRLPTLVCTVYEPAFENELVQRAAKSGLPLFNDAISRCALTASVPILDLRKLILDRQDLANEIEPSDQGGNKIAKAIANFMRPDDA